MKLFDDIERTYVGPAGYAEPHFTYFNRSARTDIEAMREYLERWFRYYPDSLKKEFRSRFRSDLSRHHYGAFTEMYCYYFLKKLGWKVTPIPTEVGKTTPDFLAKKGKFECVFECTVATEFGHGNATYERMNVLHDALNKVECPDFFFHLEMRRYPSKSPNGSGIRTWLSNKLAKVKYEDVGPDVLKLKERSPYYWVWNDDNLEFAIWISPKTEEGRKKKTLRPLGSLGTGVYVDESRDVLFDALKPKAGKYGDLQKPYVIVLNCLKTDIDTFDISGALFGSAQLTMKSDGSTRDTRAANGIWHGPGGVRNTKVSGVLILPDIEPWTISKRDPVLWLNPWPKYRFDHRRWGGSVQIPNNEVMRTELRKGKAAHSIFGIDAGWPTNLWDWSTYHA